MKYAIYFMWHDGEKDTFNVDNAYKRDIEIKDMIKSRNFKYIEYCPIYRNGEYGCKKIALNEGKNGKGNFCK